MRVEIPGDCLDIGHVASEAAKAGERTFSGAARFTWPLPECAALRRHYARKGVPAQGITGPASAGPFFCAAVSIQPE